MLAIPGVGEKLVTDLEAVIAFNTKKLPTIIFQSIWYLSFPEQQKAQICALLEHENIQDIDTLKYYLLNNNLLSIAGIGPRYAYIIEEAMAMQMVVNNFQNKLRLSELVARDLRKKLKNEALLGQAI